MIATKILIILVIFTKNFCEGKNSTFNCVKNLNHPDKNFWRTNNCCRILLCDKNDNFVSEKLDLLQNLCKDFFLQKDNLKKCKNATEQSNSFSPSSYVKTSNLRTPDKKIRFENITTISTRISGLQFLDVPKGDEMRIHKLKLDEEYLLFEIFSSLMGYLLPANFPTDLVRDALQQRVSFHLFTFQLLKTEFAALGWMIFWTVIAIIIPFIVFTYFCCSTANLQRLREDSSDIIMDFRDKCVERTLTILLLFFLTLKIFPIILIFLGNEQISRQSTKLVATTDLIFNDLSTFSRNTHMQMSFVATSSTDITIEAIRKDLDDIENLLGLPYKKLLAQETGIEAAFDELNEIQENSDEVTSLVSQLISDCTLANNERFHLQEKLKEISRELALVRQQCKSRDRSLCYTLQYTGLEVMFSCGNLSFDPRLKQLQEKNFNRTISNAKTTFQQVPSRVAEETLSHVAEIKLLLSRQRTQVYKSAHSLDELFRSVLNSIKILQDLTIESVENLNQWEIYRWLSILGISTIILLVWGLLLCGAPCGCGLTSRTIPCLLTGISLIALLSLIVWSLGILTFLLGSHSQTLLCQPLYDHPYYKALTEILNEGIFHKEEIFKRNDSLKIPQILKNCRLNQPSYTTFHLNNYFNTSSTTNPTNWPQFQTTLKNLTLPQNLEILTPSLQLNLQFLATLSVNFSDYRARISAPITRRDLNSFADQLNNVARQSLDLQSSKRLDDLAVNVRRLLKKECTRLVEFKDRILYKITALEILIHPLSQQANRSLTHLKDVQFFLNYQSGDIGQKIVDQFRERINSYLEEMYHYISTKLEKDIGRCRPLWEIFNSVRFFLCKLIIDPINGISVSCFSLTILFLGIVIVVLNLVEHYRELNEELLTSITHRRTRDGVLIDDEGTWAIPSSESPLELRQEQSWISPHFRQSVEPLIPPPPRMPSRVRSPKRLSTIASRITAARVPQIPSVSRARSPKRNRHESLRLIEPICWKSGSLSPRSWI